MARIFDERAELGGLLANEEPLVVSKAIQKAFIEVNEEGAEAAAATGKSSAWVTGILFLVENIPLCCLLTFRCYFGWTKLIVVFD